MGILNKSLMVASMMNFANAFQAAIQSTSLKAGVVRTPSSTKLGRQLTGAFRGNKSGARYPHSSTKQQLRYQKRFEQMSPKEQNRIVLGDKY